MTANPFRTDAIIRFRILTAEEGGRARAITGPEYRQIFRLRGRPDSYWSIFVYPMDQALQPGATYELPVLFIAPELVFAFLKPGDEIELCEGPKAVAQGTVISVFPQAA